MATQSNERHDCGHKCSLMVSLMLDGYKRVNALFQQFLKTRSPVFNKLTAFLGEENPRVD